MVVYVLQPQDVAFDNWGQVVLAVTLLIKIPCRLVEKDVRVSDPFHHVFILEGRFRPHPQVRDRNIQNVFGSRVVPLVGADVVLSVDD